MQYQPYETVASKLSDFAGVTFTLRRLSHGQRTQLRLRLAESLHLVRTLNEKIELEVDRYALQPESEEGKSTPFTKEQLLALERVNDLSRAIDLVTYEKVDPQYLQFCLVHLDGIIDEHGQPFTADTLYKTGPEELCKEVIEECVKLVNMSPKAKESFELPTTSGALVAGQTSAMTANNASATAGTGIEIVRDTSRTC